MSLITPDLAEFLPQDSNALTLEYVEPLLPFFDTHDEYNRPYRYKMVYGGRGSSKSWSAAQAIIGLCYARPHRVLCTREFQSSMKDSVHRLLSDQIHGMGLSHQFKITEDSIRCWTTGSEIIFKGLRNSINEIRSTEGIDLCWIEEAQTISDRSLEVLIPTIRKPGSQIWATWNPLNDPLDIPGEPITKRFVLDYDKVPDAPAMWRRKINYDENPFLDKTSDDERRYLQRIDREAYTHVWEGFPRRISAATVFKDRYEVCSFDSPHSGPGQNSDVRFYYGADFGYSNDPSTLIRCFVEGNILHIDYEAYRVGVEINDLPDFYLQVPDSARWPIKADNARPETISYLQNGHYKEDGRLTQAFNISAAEKWKGSVEDGIAHLKGFEKIRIHERCKHTAQEFRLYSFKTDRLNPNQVLPILVDQHNHMIDALRYALDDFIHARGEENIWAKLGRL